MDIRPITADYAVSPQVTPEDMAEVAAKGFALVICNRPDSEIPPDLHARQVAAAARSAGLDFAHIPLGGRTLDEAIVARQSEAMAGAGGPVLAYCASGTRCTWLWAFSQRGKREASEIVSLAAAQGYDISPISDALG